MTGVLVTGGAGFIGSHFVRRWRAAHPGDTIVVLDALTYAGGVDNLDGVADIAFVHSDIRDRARVASLIDDHRLDTIVHFAAETHVDRSIASPGAFVETNVLGTQALLDAARAAWLDRGRDHRFHHVSTDEVYGEIGRDAPAAKEAAPLRPSSPYAASKAAGDHLVAAYARTYGLQATISRCPNNYGPRQFPEKLLPFFLIRALGGARMPLYGDGSQRRDWLHVDDHCRGIEQVLARGSAGETYNLGGTGELSNRSAAEMLCRAVDRAFAADPSLAARFPASPPARGQATEQLMSNVDDRAGHDHRYAIDWTKSRDAFDYAPSTPFDEGVSDMVNWYLGAESWWRARHDAPEQPS